MGHNSSVSPFESSFYLRRIESMTAFRPHFVAAFLLSLTFVSSASETESRKAVPENIAQSTLRLKLETVDGDYLTTGWGAAFGIDLSGYGASDSRYLLSAAHLVLSKSGHGLAKGELKVEIPVNGKSSWTVCKVVAVDQKRDLCLLRAGADIPVLSKLCGKEEQKIGETVMIVGCPSGVPPCVSIGKLTDKTPNVEGKLWEAAAKFYHGNSGGPVFDALNGQVIGVAVAGVSNGRGDMQRDKALFSPAGEIRNFIETMVAPLLR